MQTQKTKILILILGMFLISFVSAGNLNLFPNPNEKNVNIQYTFNLTTSPTNCSENVLISHSEIVRTNPRGFGYVSIPIPDNLTEIPTYLCEVKDGSVRKIHPMSSQIFDHIFARNLNLSGDANVAGTLYYGTLDGEGNLNVNSSDFLSIYDSSYFMPLNTSVSGNFDFNGGWVNDGLSIIGGDIYAQTGYFYNITSLNVTKQNLTVIENLIVGGNITADYFIGDGSLLTGIGITETDPLWAGNYSLVYFKSNPFSFYNSSTIPSYILTTNEGNLNVNSSNFWDNYNIPTDLNNLLTLHWANITSKPTHLSNFTDNILWTTTFNASIDNRVLGDNSSWNQTFATTLYSLISEPLWSGNQSLVYLKSNPFSFYNSSTIPSYILTTNEGNLNVNSSNFWDNYNTPAGFLWTGSFNATGDTRWLTSYSETDPLWSGNQSLVYLKSNPSSFWNSTFALFNKTYADNLYADISVTGDNSSWNQTFATTLYRADSWNNFTGIPHATPSNNDVTHFSLADEIYDWAVGLFLQTMDYTNVAMTNITETFDENVSFSKNIHVTGNVGIGTTSPDDLLHIYAGDSTASPHSYSQLVVEDDTHVALQLMSPNTTAQYLFFGDPESASVGQITYVHGEDRMGFITNGANQMTILSSGKVGIGTSSPSGLLHLKGTGPNMVMYDDANATTDGGGVRLIHQYVYTGTTGQTTGSSIKMARTSITEGNYGSYISFTTRDHGVAASEKVRIQDDGKVGIGTGNPNEKLHVAGDIVASIDLHTGGTTYTQNLEVSSHTYLYGETEVKGLRNQYYITKIQNTNTTHGYGLAILAGDDENEDILSLQNSTGSHMFIFDASGEASCFGSDPCWNFGSSREIKKDIVAFTTDSVVNADIIKNVTRKTKKIFNKEINETRETEEIVGVTMDTFELSLSSILEEFKRIPIYSYKYKDDDYNRTQIGLIAEEAPYLVNGLNNRFLSAGSMVNYLWVVTRAQQDKIDFLETENLLIKTELCVKDPTYSWCHS